MKGNKNNIEDLFKNGLKEHSLNPSNSVWKNINRKLNIQNFLKFKPGKFNIYYATVIIATSTILLISTFNNRAIIEEKNTITENNLLLTENNINNNEVKIPEIKNDKQTTKINNQKIINTGKEIIKKTETEKNYIETKEKTTETEHITKAKSSDEENNNVILAEPIADFSASTYGACVPVVVHFTNASENCDSYLWNFGNGKTSSEINPTFVFRTAGTYTVTLTVKSGSISNSVSKVIKVFPKPVSEFIVSDKDNIFENDEVKFANLSTGYKSCFWDFGNENTSSFTHPTNTYYNSGLYNVSLICFSENNCSDTSVFLNLRIHDSKYQVLAPTAFYADLNGQNNGYDNNRMYSNTIFHPVFNYETSEYYLRIFNKFGTIVFESRNPDFGWNGYYNNKPAPDAVYVWECSGKFADGEAFIKSGNVTLLYLK
ncbi:MAG: PKD domain-containing protein [Bacteroidales bacterium]|nr:PKD domain-containing protein [Bacteroidales bacterium]